MAFKAPVTPKQVFAAIVATVFVWVTTVNLVPRINPSMTVSRATVQIRPDVAVGMFNGRGNGFVIGLSVAAELARRSHR